MSRSVRVLKVAVAGAGVVGGGVIELIKRQRSLFRAQGFDFVVKTVLCRDAARPRDFTVEHGTGITTDVSAITGDDDLDIIVEVTGHHDTAQALFDAAYAKGQVLVTANKSYLAEHLGERRLRSGGLKLGYEAAVAGGIPIIKTLAASLAVDTPTCVAGIMNGTTNFILSSMANGGGSYGEALAGAQAAGFAEADPTADVEGHDARNKLVLLTHLAYGVVVPPAKLPTLGITTVSGDDFALWKEYNATVKLLGVAQVYSPPAAAAAAAAPTATAESGSGAASSSASAASAEGGAGSGAAAASAASPPLTQKLLDVFVSPVIVPCDSAFGRTAGGMNLIHLNTAAVGVSEYYGPGAGRFPTANSIVADMVAFATKKAVKAFPRPSPRAVGLNITNGNGQLPRRFYVRGPSELVHRASLALWRQHVEVKPLPLSSSSGEAAFVTGPTPARTLASLLRRLEHSGSGSGSGTGSSSSSSSSASSGGAAAADAASAAAAAPSAKPSYVMFPVWDGVRV